MFYLLILHLLIDFSRPLVLKLLFLFKIKILIKTNHVLNNSSINTFFYIVSKDKLFPVKLSAFAHEFISDI